jgi:hypothetical protein
MSRRRIHSAGEVELGDELGPIEDLAAVFGPPTEQRQIVEHRLREVAGVAELLEGDGTVTLRQLGPVGAHDQGQVGVRRARRHTERLSEREHAVGGVEQVLSPDDVRDRHLDVVDRVGEEEQRRAVRADDHEVGNGRPLDADLSPDDVAEGAGAVVGRPEPERPRAALGAERGTLVGIEVAAVAVVAGGAPGGAGSLVARSHLFFCAVALIGAALGEEPTGGGVVPVGAGALEDRAFVPVESQPRERVLDRGDPLRARPGDVGVLDAEGEGPPLVAGEQPVEQRGVGAADVEGTGRSG